MTDQSNDPSSGAPSAAAANAGYTMQQIYDQVFNFDPVTASGDVVTQMGNPATYSYQPSGMSQGSKVAPYRGSIGVTAATPNTTVKPRDIVTGFMNMPPDQLASWTSRMYAAGLYPPSSYAKGAKPPNGKVMTDADVAAANNLVQNTLFYGGTKSVNDVLNGLINAGAGQDAINKAQQGQGKTTNVTTDDPAELRASVTKVAQGLLGRALSDDETNALVNQMIQQERTPQLAAVSAGQANDQGTDVTLETARVNAEARLAESVKAQNPTESTAYGQLNYFNLLQSALGGNSANETGTGGSNVPQ